MPGASSYHSRCLLTAANRNTLVHVLNARCCVVCDTVLVCRAAHHNYVTAPPSRHAPGTNLIFPLALLASLLCLYLFGIVTAIFELILFLLQIN